MGDLLEPLSTGEAQPLREWLTARGVEPERLWRLPRWNAEDERAGAPSMRRRAGRREQAAEELAVQVPKVLGTPGGVVCLLLYLRYEVAETWEVSYHFGLLWDTLGAAVDYFAAHPMPADDDEATAVASALALIECLDAEIRAENAMVCAVPGALARAADAAADKAALAAELAARVEASMPWLTAYVIELARAREAYNRAVATAAGALVGFLRSGTPLAPAIAALSAAEAGLGRDERARSCLQAHRFSLTALADAADRGWLRVDRGKIAYLYPFAIRGMTASDVVRTAVREAGGWRLGGVLPVEVHQSLDLDDVWDGSDSLGRRYDGAHVGLPDVAIRLDGERIQSVRAQLRLSLLGNHYVRFEADLSGASPADIYAMTLRAAPESGTAEVAFEGVGATVAEGADRTNRGPIRLSDLAVRLTEDLRERLGGAEAGVQVITRPGMFRLVISVNAASRVRRCEGRVEAHEIQAAHDLADLVGGQVLTNPVTFMVGSMAEWIRYAPDHALARDVRVLADEWVVCTSNTTLLAGLGVPMWGAGTRESVAEFVASLEGLLAGWSSELAGYYQTVQRLQERLPGPEEARRMTVQALRELADNLEREKMRLHDFAIETRSAVGLIRSPSLVASPVAASMLALLLDWSDFGRRIRELEVTVDEVLDERLALSIDKLTRQRLKQESAEEARVQQRQRAKLDTLLAVIAAIGVSGIGQILQGGYDLGERGSLAIIAAIVVLSVIVGGFFWWSAGAHQRRGPGGPE
ncbi:hypothetical protein [Streptomyces sp. HPF1205]|uniref:hypothetical protein n=1 Tax=Streptomyces sp. HPF1205 TaxID=2873262 RepID=UPI001CEC43EC|nr:hypothetical protein [Streptomyces sp. HPF1205]